MKRTLYVKKQIPDIWWVEIKNSYVEAKPMYPQSSEAYMALNTLVWYCVWRWMESSDFNNSDDLLYAMSWYIKELRSIINNQ